MAGNPAKLTGMVYRSLEYNSLGHFELYCLMEKQLRVSLALK